MRAYAEGNCKPGYLTVHDYPGTLGVMYSEVSWPGESFTVSLLHGYVISDAWFTVCYIHIHIHEPHARNISRYTNTNVMGQAFSIMNC